MRTVRPCRGVAVVQRGSARHTAGRTQLLVGLSAMPRAARRRGRRAPKTAVPATKRRRAGPRARAGGRRVDAAVDPPGPVLADAGRAAAEPVQRPREERLAAQPGLTVMHSTRSTSSISSATDHQPACRGRRPGRRGSRPRAPRPARSWRAGSPRMERDAVRPGPRERVDVALGPLNEVDVDVARRRRGSGRRARRRRGPS